MTAPLWSYWEGPLPPLYSLCLETLERHNPTFRLVGPADIIAMGGSEVWDWTQGLPIPQRSDLLRLWLLKREGGVWVDADTIATAPLDLVDQVDSWDLIGIYNRHFSKPHGMIATPFGGRKGSSAIARLYHSCRGRLEKMKRGDRVPYGSTSVGLLSDFCRQNSKNSDYRIARLEHWRYCPVPWSQARQVFLAKGPRHRFEKRRFNPNAACWHLTNPIPDAFKSATREEILSGPTFTSFLIQKGLGMRPAVPGRSWESLQRIAPGQPTVAVEVGVMRGDNARQLLQQRRDLVLHLVDPWEVVEDADYKATGDYQTRFGQPRWDHVYEACCRAVAFAADRAVFHREHSAKAAAEFEPQSVDLVFIDANHSYAGVKSDIAAWLPKIRPGGWMGGHDYHHKREGRGYGVTQAVDEFAASGNHTIHTGCDYTWFIRV